MKCMHYSYDRGGGRRSEMLPVAREGAMCLRLPLCIYVATGHCGADNICADNIRFTLKV